jgi:hypothetical protein
LRFVSFDMMLGLLLRKIFQTRLALDQNPALTTVDFRPL